MRFEILETEVRIDYEGINASGQHETSSQTLNVDGEPHSHPAVAGLIVVSRLRPYSLESTATKDGAVLGDGSYSVSENGDIMTARIRGIDASGRTFEQTIVFDRAH